jgi:hypothetical protein
MLLTTDLNGNDAPLSASFDFINDRKVTTFDNKSWFFGVEFSLDTQLVLHFSQILAMELLVLIGIW